jgi:peptidoglycan/LPS O-acetylase OafA/YrhL
MIEITRFLLAAIVAQTHIWVLSDEWLGQQSVFCFYTLSGYLITRVLNTRYGFSRSGTKAFALNRILRLWPAYLIVLAMTFAVAVFVPLGPSRIPHDLLNVLTSLTIIGETTFDYRVHPAAFPVPTSLLLAIELICYLLLAIYFAKSKYRLVALAALGAVGITLSTLSCALSGHAELYGDYCWQNRYSVIQAGFIPFAAGGLLYFGRDMASRWARQNPVTITLVLIALDAFCAKSPFIATNFAIYIGIAIMAFLIALSVDTPATKLEDFFGRASYHLFISHLTIAPALIALAVPAGSLSLYLKTMLFSVLLSVFLVPLEHKIDRVRRRISSADGLRAEPGQDFISPAPNRLLHAQVAVDAADR